MHERVKSHENVCKDHDYCHMVIPEEDNNIFKYHQDKYFMTFLFFIYADIEQILEKIQACDNNPQESSQPKKANIQRVATHYSHTVYSMTAKAKMIFTEVLPI